MWMAIFKIVNHWKILRKMQKISKLLKTKRILKPKYKLSGDPVFTFSLPGKAIHPSDHPPIYATGHCPSFLSAFAPTFSKNLSNCSSFVHLNVQLPSWKTQSLSNSFFHKVWNLLPTACFASSSNQFRSNLFHQRSNVYQLHGCNLRATAILSMHRPSNKKLNIDVH